jgi:hypothetical protein
VQKGPLLAADLFNIGQTGCQLFIGIHHLVIDIVSWGIILHDLEDFFSSGKIRSRSSLPFQSWCRLQSENAQKENGKLVLPHQETSTLDLEYWNLEGRPNIYGDVITEEIELDAGTTQTLLVDCHKSLQTDTLDILLASLLLSYRKAFPDRQVTPTIYNEGHGREPWDQKLDLSRTVGWFTTLCPVNLPIDSSSGKQNLTGTSLVY